MRVLTVRQPWAWAIIHGGKTVENRARNPAGSYRGPVAIHAGLRFDFDGYKVAAGLAEHVGGFARFPHYRRNDWVFGAIIGVVDLVDVHDGADESLHTMAGEVLATDACSPWALPDHQHLVLANSRQLPDPIPYKGALGLRRLDPDTIARIEAQLTVFRPDTVNTIVTERLR